MKTAILSAFVALNTLAVADQPTKPPGCNDVQERIVARVEEIRGYSPHKFLKACTDGNMTFTDKDYLPAFFLTRPDGTTYACIPAEKGKYACIEPKDENETLEAFTRLYSIGRINI